MEADRRIHQYRRALVGIGSLLAVAVVLAATTWYFRERSRTDAENAKVAAIQAHAQ